MATNLHQPSGQPPPAAQKPGRWQTLRDRSTDRATKARAQFATQRGHAKARTGDWLRGSDLSDAELSALAARNKKQNYDRKVQDAERAAAEARARFAVAKAMAKHDRDNDYSSTLATLAGQVAAEESALDAVCNEAVSPPTQREVNTTRLRKRATRVGILAAGGFATLKGVTMEPNLLVVLGAAGSYGWYLVSRPFGAGSAGGGETPFVTTPPQSLPPLWAPQGGEPATGGTVVMSVEQLPGEAKPFPMRQAQTPEQLAQCVLLAMAAENVPVVEVADVVRHAWGWECRVRQNEGTPEAIIKATGDLETRLDLRTNGVRPQPMLERRACTILRLVDGDPFASAPGLPYRPPKSLSITDRFRIGTSVCGDPLEVSLAGVMGLWVASSGGGKTGILQALAEGTTACYDNITIDLDPHGDGLEDLHDCVRITARTNEQIEAVLLFFLVMSKARARLRQKLGMGKKWKASATHPAFTIFFDEFPKGSDLAKKLAFELLLVGRKELIELELASQGGTKLYLGENIAQMIAMAGVGPCKVGDTRAVFGDGSVAEGWLPHKLSPATATDPKDAGHIFIKGVPGMPDEPIEYAIHEAPSATLRYLATERLEAGLLEPDRDSLDAMKGVDLPEYVEATYDNDGNIKKDAPVELLTWDQLLRLCDALPAEPDPLADGAPRRAVEDAVAVMEKAPVDRMKTESLLQALRDYDPDVYGQMAVEAFKALMGQAGAGAPIPLGQIGEEKNPRGFKRDRLRQLL